MYHYVRGLKHSRFPEIKGLSVEFFKAQLEYIRKHYSPISMEELVAAIKSNSELPGKALLLTFDDGYADHFMNVFPILNELKIQGSFFPPAKAILKHKVLDVNKIHFMLASVDNKFKIADEIFSFLDRYRAEFSLYDNQYYFNKLAKPGRFDSKEVVFIKSMLQKELPEKLRSEITKELFDKYVTEDEAGFSEELYMNINQLKQMKERGMFMGSHGFGHCWLDKLDKAAQEKEIELSLDFLFHKLGCDNKDWVMSYPYGSYNDSLVCMLKKMGCAVGLTSETRVADISKDNPLTLPRLDTNDIDG
jgi:peptidoglycan/xylan/chitin deacetylase (PgdA/CDA1 family)